MTVHKAFKALTKSTFSRSPIFNESVQKGLFALGDSKEIDVERPPMDQMRQLVGKTLKYSTDIGPHPDFSHLEFGQTEMGYAVTVFVDIKGSTLLGTKLPLDEVRYLKNGIITAAIGIFQVFDGHIHRIQGDAVMAYFRRQDMSKAQSIVDALNASTFLQLYINQELSPLFEAQGYFPLQIRIGIDYGDEPVVLWSKYGILNCFEITTTSLHTDLAAKLQHEAPANGVMVGDNVVTALDLPDEFLEVRTYQENYEQVPAPYIVDTQDYRYKMWVFDWRKYAQRTALLPKKSNFPYQSPDHFRVRGFYQDSQDANFASECFANCSVLRKGLALKFTLEAPDALQIDDVQWQVINRGREAEVENALNFEMTNYRGKRYCLQSTRYKGHHYMQCTLYHQRRIVGREHFGVYIDG